MWYEKAAICIAGSSAAMLKMAEICRRKEHWEQSNGYEKPSWAWYKKAAEAGSPTSMFTMAVICEKANVDHRGIIIMIINMINLSARQRVSFGSRKLQWLVSQKLKSSTLAIC